MHHPCTTPIFRHKLEINQNTVPKISSTKKVNNYCNRHQILELPKNLICFLPQAHIIAQLKRVHAVAAVPASLLKNNIHARGEQILLQITTPVITT